jgi:transketolase
MAFKMNGMSFGEGTGSSPNKKIYGTSSKDLMDLSYEERSKYKSWKKRERQSGKKGAHHDNTYEAYLRSKDTKKPRTKRKSTGRVKNWLKNLFTPKDSKGKSKPTTIAQRDVYEDFLLGNRPGASATTGDDIRYINKNKKS